MLDGEAHRQAEKTESSFSKLMFCCVPVENKHIGIDELG
jgi:hypothetical protein